MPALLALSAAGAVQLRNELISAFGVELSPTITFDYPVPSALASFIASHMAPTEVDMDVKEAPERAPAPAAPQQVPPMEGQKDAMLADVLDIVTSIIGSSIAADEPFMATGLDSLGAVQLRNAVSERFGTELPATAALDFPTAATLAGYLLRSSAPSVAIAATGILYDSYSDGSFADSSATEIVGVSCMYPGAAAETGLDGFWQTAFDGGDVPSVVPYNRWAIERYHDPETVGKP